MRHFLFQIIKSGCNEPLYKVFYYAGTNIKDIALPSYNFIIIYNMHNCQMLFNYFIKSSFIFESIKSKVLFETLKFARISLEVFGSYILCLLMVVI